MGLRVNQKGLVKVFRAEGSSKGIGFIEGGWGQTDRQTERKTDRQTDTRAHAHTHTKANTQKHIHTRARTHTHTRTHAPTHTHTSQETSEVEAAVANAREVADDNGGARVREAVLVRHHVFGLGEALHCCA